MLKHRIITAIILFPLVVWCIFALPTLGLALVFAVFVALGAWEWSKLMGLQSVIYRGCYVLITLGGMFIIYYFLQIVLISWTILLIGFFWWMMVLYFVFHYAVFCQLWENNFLLRAIMGLLVLLPSWAGLSIIHLHEHGAYLVAFVLILVWCADSAAYFVGRKWGRHKLVPKISPGKTIEGVIGGLICVLLVTALFVALMPLALYQNAYYKWLIWLGVALLVSFGSVLGDLFESMAKRQSGIKDSGQILPGHGGILDRIDSLTAAIPLFALAILAMRLL